MKVVRKTRWREKKKELQEVVPVPVAKESKDAVNPTTERYLRLGVCVGSKTSFERERKVERKEREGIRCGRDGEIVWIKRKHEIVRVFAAPAAVQMREGRNPGQTRQGTLGVELSTACVCMAGFTRLSRKEKTANFGDRSKEPSHFFLISQQSTSCSNSRLLWQSGGAQQQESQPRDERDPTPFIPLQSGRRGGKIKEIN